MLASLPIFMDLLRGSPVWRRRAWFAIALIPFLVSSLHLDVGLISWAMWPGYVKGAVISLLDTLCLALILTDRRHVRSTPLLWAFLLFMAGSAVATIGASPAEASMFFTWQLGWNVVVFLAVSRAASRMVAIRQITAGLAVAACIEAAFSLKERAKGVTQASGLMVHQNMLGMCMHFALLLSLAAVLSGDRRPVMKAGVAAALIAVALTGSRATTVLALAAVAVLLMLSLIRQPTAVKTKTVGIAALGLVLAAPIGYLSLESRFGAGPVFQQDGEREAFERAARAMWSDHPMGVGANQYVVRANVDGYSDRAGVTWAYTSRGTNVHNTYLLLGAETGYLGLGTFLILMFAGIGRAFQLAWARPKTSGGEMALGAAVALSVVAIHCLYEWVFVTSVPQELFAITMGIISGLANQRKMERRERRRLAPRPVEEEVAPAWAEPVPA